MTVLEDTNLAVRFLLELAALAAVVHWGFRIGRNQFTRAVLGIGVPILMAVIWALFVPDDSAIDTEGPIKFAVEVLIFAAAVAALARIGRYRLAGALALAYSINRVLMAVWDQ